MVITTLALDDLIAVVRAEIDASFTHLGIGEDSSTSEGIGNTDLDDELGTTFGDATSRFDITDEGGDTFRYTWDGVGTDPEFDSSMVATDGAKIDGDNFNAANNGTFPVEAVDAGGDWFEVTNASGVAEADKTLGNADAIQIATNRKAITWDWDATNHVMSEEIEIGFSEHNSRDIKEIGIFDDDQFGAELQLRDVIESFSKTSARKYRIDLQLQIIVGQ